MFSLLLLSLTYLPSTLLANLLAPSFGTSLLAPWSLNVTTSDHIHYCLLVSKVTPADEPTGHFLRKLDRLLESIFLLSRGVPLHFILLTEDESISSIIPVMERVYARAVMQRLLWRDEQHKKERYKIPRVIVEFVSYEKIVQKYQDSIVAMKRHFNNWDREYAVKGNIYQDGTLSFVSIGMDGEGKSVSVGFRVPSRYDKDIFYLTPFYHLVFPVKKMIFTDVDVVFKVMITGIIHKVIFFLFLDQP